MPDATQQIALITALHRIELPTTMRGLKPHGHAKILPLGAHACLIATMYAVSIDLKTPIDKKVYANGCEATGGDELSLRLPRIKTCPLVRLRCKRGSHGIIRWDQ